MPTNKLRRIIIISEIDIKDWDKSIKEARRAVDNLDDYSKMEVGVNPIGDVFFLELFINKIEALVKSNVSQVPALFKPPIKKD